MSNPRTLNMEDVPNPPPPCQHLSLAPTYKAIVRKQRVKFGLFWLLFTLLTGGLGLVLWLLWPRKKVVTGQAITSQRCVSCGLVVA